MRLRDRLAELVDGFSSGGSQPPPTQQRTQQPGLQGHDPRDRQNLPEPERDEAVGMFFAAESAATMDAPDPTPLEPVTAPENVSNRCQADDTGVDTASDDAAGVPRVDDLLGHTDSNPDDRRWP